MAKKKTNTDQPTAQNPLILRANRLMDAFAKSDEERDFYLDRVEGFLILVDLDKTQEQLDDLEAELGSHAERYCLIPKLSYYETKKIMEGFVNEKVFDIDIKEKLLDIIQSKEARENFIEFIHDHISELEKWQQFYQERSRIRIIEWLRKNNFHFVFEEDLDIPLHTMELVKENLFSSKVGKDVQAARKTMVAKAQSYYSNEALNPKPKRGRPPKQVAKSEMEPQMTSDIYTQVPSAVRPFLYIPEIKNATEVTFSSKYETRQDLVAHMRESANDDSRDLNQITEKLAALRQLTEKWHESEAKEVAAETAEELPKAPKKRIIPREKPKEKAEPKPTKAAVKKAPAKKAPAKKTPAKKTPTKKAAPAKKKAPTKKRIMPAKKKTEKESKTPMRRARKLPPKKTK